MTNIDIRRSQSALRTDFFKTKQRDTSTQLLISYTRHEPDPRIDAAYIDINHCKRGYFGIFYHYLISTNGTIEMARDPKTISSAGYIDTQPHRIDIGIVGGLDEDGRRASTMNPEQQSALGTLQAALVVALGADFEVVTDLTASWIKDAASRNAEQAKMDAMSLSDRLLADDDGDDDPDDDDGDIEGDEQSR